MGSVPPQAQDVSWQSLATEIEDFRHAQGQRHLRSDMLSIAVCACIGGVHAMAGIAACGRDHHQAWFATWLALPHGIPAHDTCDRVLQLLDPQQLEALFARWVESRRLWVRRPGWPWTARPCAAPTTGASSCRPCRG